MKTHKDDKAVGIDLGTTYSSIAYVNASGVVEIIPNRDGEMKTRSLVSVAGAEPVVGLVAERDLVLEPERTAQLFKRCMGSTSDQGKPIPLVTDPQGREWTAVDLSACVLKELKTAAETQLGEPIPNAVITNPAYFDEVAREATKAAACIAGFKQVRLIEEPVAAATHYSLEKGHRELMVVLDYGGGTLDVTAIENTDRIRAVAIEGDAELGGSNHDEALLEIVVERLRAEGVELSPESDLAAWYQNLDRVREAKEMLARRDPVTLVAEASGKRVPIQLSRAMLRETCKDLEERFRGCCRRLLEALGPRRSEIARVLLVGGSTRLPHIPGLVEEIFGLAPSQDTDADLVVAKGAAVIAASHFHKGDQAICLGGHRYLPSDIRTQTVAAHALCVAALKAQDPSDKREYNSPLIFAGTPLPASAQENFAPVDPRASEVKVKIVQGEPGQPSDTGLLLREFALPVQQGATDDQPITVKMAYTEEGLLEVEAVDRRLNRPQSVTFTHRAGLTEAEIKEKKEQLEGVGAGVPE